jgi:hypothetical protein
MITVVLLVPAEGQPDPRAPLSTLHADSRLEPIGLEARLRDVVAELASLDARAGRSTAGQ